MYVVNIHNCVFPPFPLLTFNDKETERKMCLLAPQWVLINESQQQQHLWLCPVQTLPSAETLQSYSSLLRPYESSCVISPSRLTRHQLLVWPEWSPEDVAIVTITPEYPGSRHTGLVSGLRKFTRYFGSALCFTTPGDGPRSPPTLLQTQEDSECSRTRTHAHARARAHTRTRTAAFGYF